MDTKFSHLLGDIRQPVLVIGDDPDTAGNVLVAAFQPAQSVPAANVYDAAVASPTDTVEGAQPAADTTTTANDAATTTAADTTTTNTATYADNGDGTWTREQDGARGHFGPDGFVASGGEEVTGVTWGQ